ncbi:MAG: YigZ family protein [Bacilli bacterium]|nr:YigZ family protein [Bacilli bacterium]
MKTVNNSYQTKIEVEKSKFIGLVYPLTSEEQFKEILKGLQKEHKKARHIVYAYRIGQKSKSCDDGEPKGTAGRPLLELLHKKELNNLVLFVVRYFGGIKLGAGRLLRTYVNAGVEVLNSAELVELEA